MSKKQPSKPSPKPSSKPARQSSQSFSPQQLDRWVFYGFLAILVALPIVISRITFDQFDIAKILALRILTLAIVLFWVVKMLNSKKREIRWTWLDYSVLAFVVLVFISTITSIHLPTAIHGKFKRYEGFLTFINYGIIYFLAIQTFTDFKRLSTVSKTVTLSGAFVALYGVMQYVGMDPLPWATLPFEERRSFSTFGNPDLLAGFLVILVPFAVVEFLKAKDSKNNALMGVSLFLTFLCLLTAFTRSGWVGSFAAILVLAPVAGRTIISKPRKLAFVGGSFVAIFAVIAVYSATTGHNVLNLVARLKSMTQFTEGSAGSRLEIWKGGLEMIKAKPIFGWGPDTFRLTSERYETLNYVKIGGGGTVADNAHNWIVQLGAGVGLPATLLLLAFIGTAVVLGIKYARSLTGDDRLTYSAFIAAVVGYMVHLLFGVSISGSTGVFWVLLGALAAVLPIVKTADVGLNRNYSSALQVVAVLAVVVAMASAYFALSMFMADNSYARAIQLSNAGDVQNAELAYQNSIRLYKNGRYYDGYGMFLERMGMAQSDRNAISRAAEVYREGKYFEPGEADHYVFLAGALAKLAGGPTDPVIDDAVNELKQAIKVRPNAYSARLLLANILMYQGNQQEALPYLKFVLDINPNEASAIQLLAQAYEDLGDKKEARVYYEKLAATGDTKAKDALERLKKN